LLDVEAPTFPRESAQKIVDDGQLVAFPALSEEVPLV
jgi:hypothetical protein